MSLRDGRKDDEQRIEALLQDIEAKIAEIRQVNDSKAFNSFEIEAPFIDKILITSFRTLSEKLSRIALAIAIAAVQKKEITKRNAADRLRIHPHTLDRAIRRYEESPDHERHPLMEILDEDI